MGLWAGGQVFIDFQKAGSTQLGSKYLPDFWGWDAIYPYTQNFTQLAQYWYMHSFAEGALKLKELAYIHAEGFAGGELKHGPIALIEEGTAVIAILPEYVVDFYFAFAAGSDPSMAPYASANLTGANLAYAHLKSANLTGANLTSANLTSANLTDTIR